MLKVVIYARVSTKRDAQKNSLENQVSYAMNLAAQNGWSVVGQYIDDGISGATRNKREGIQRLLYGAKKKNFDAVIAKSVSRLGRNAVENLQTAHEIESVGIRLILPEDNYDTETSSSRLMFNLKAVLAEEESAKLSERIKIGLRASARQGVYKASLPAFGYKRDPLRKRLELDENFAPIVRKIFDLYLCKDWGMYKISNHLIDQGIPTPRTVSGGSNAGELWHQSTVKLILSNIVYTGTLVQHQEETKDFISKRRKQVEPDKQIVFKDAHPAIISIEEYNAVQEKMRQKGTSKSNGRESLFAHLAVCADCGKGMVFRTDRRKSGAYVCGGYVKHSRSYCSSHIVEFDTLLQAVKDDLKELIADNVKLEKLYGAAHGKANEQQAKINKELTSVSKRLNQLNKEFQSLLQLYSEKVIDIVQFKSQNEHIQEEQARLTHKKAEIESLLVTKKDMDEQLHAFRKQIARFAKLDINDEQVFKQILHRLIQRIEVNEEGMINAIHYNITCPQSFRALEKRGA
ncbi:recombinase family protein [Paenibacillus aquistagni]|uniref:recombinase family protein n=1 Tax=Paenibacillus aquistagni TaxID=1852522 RepID=UPI002165D26A|nr:recombinase family protein [Paenibacillus aquistagni]